MSKKLSNYGSLLCRYSDCDSYNETKGYSWMQSTAIRDIKGANNSQLILYLLLTMILWMRIKKYIADKVRSIVSIGGKTYEHYPEKVNISYQKLF